MLNSIKYLNLKTILYLIRIVGKIAFSLLVLTPISIGVISLAQSYELHYGLMIIFLSVIFVFILIFRNDNKYNNVVECFFWDFKVITVSFVILIGLISFLYFKPIYDKATIEKKVEDKISKANKFIDDFENKMVEELKEKESFLAILGNVDKDLFLSYDGPDLKMPLIERSVNKIENGLEKLWLRVEELKTIEADLHDYSISNLIAKYDHKRAKKILFRKEKTLENVQSTIKRFKAIEVHFLEKKELLENFLTSFYIEEGIESLKNSFEIDIEQQDLLIKKAIDLGNRKPFTSKTSVRALSQLLNFRQSQRKIESNLKILLKKIDQYKKSDIWDRKPDFPQTSYEPLFNYWTQIEKKRKVLHSEVLSFSFSKASNLTKKNESKYKMWYDKFLDRFPVKRSRARLSRNQDIFEKDLDLMSKYKSDLYHLIRSYESYLTYKDDSNYISKDIGSVKNMSSEEVESKLQEYLSRLDTYDYNIYYLSKHPPVEVIEKFLSTYKDVEKRIEIESLIYDSDKFEQLQFENEELSKNFLEIKKRLNSFETVNKLLISYYNDKNIAIQFYEKSSVKIDKKLVQVRDRVYTDSLEIQRKRKELIAQCSGFDNELSVRYTEIEIKIKDLDKEINDWKMAFLTNHIAKAKEIKLHPLFNRLSEISEEIELLENEYNNFRTLLNENIDLSVSFINLAKTWIHLIQKFEIGWSGSKLDNFHQNGDTVSFSVIKDEVSETYSDIVLIGERTSFEFNTYVNVRLKDDLQFVNSKLMSFQRYIHLCYIIVFAIFLSIIFSIFYFGNKFYKQRKLKKCKNINNETKIDILLKQTTNRKEKMYLREHAIKVLRKIGPSSKNDLEKVENALVKLLKNCERKKKKPLSNYERSEKKLFSYLAKEADNIDRRIRRSM